MAFFVLRVILPLQTTLPHHMTKNKISEVYFFGILKQFCALKNIRKEGLFKDIRMKLTIFAAQRTANIK